MVKLSELLSLKGVPGQENSEKVSELIHLHQKIKDMMTEYDDILNKTVKFHHVKEKVSIIIFTINITFFLPEFIICPFLVLPIIFLLPQTNDIYLLMDIN